MRVTTAFNKILGLSGASVVSVAFTPDGIVVGLRRRCRRLVCPCGFSTRSTYDRSRRRWRHLDLGATRLYLEAEIRRLSSKRCGPSTGIPEVVPCHRRWVCRPTAALWARHGYKS